MINNPNRTQALGIALYGDNGHQIQGAIGRVPGCTLVAVAVAAMADGTLPAEWAGATRHASLDALLADDRVDVISLCSPRRADQARDAARCMEAGKHVYAEKPAAMTEADLDAIIVTSRRTGRRFREQAATAFDPPYRGLRRIVASGAIGTVVQVYAQKSYPWRESRPQDEAVDGGLLMQAGIYCCRFVEHIAGVRIESIDARETTLGNPDPTGQCRRAVSMMMTAGGAVASAVVNYLCPPPPGWHRWGYETLRVWGTNGFVESIDHGRIGTLAVVGQPPRSIDLLGADDDAPQADHLSMFLDEVRTGRDVIPLSIEEELSPTRWVIRAKVSADRA